MASKRILLVGCLLMMALALFMVFTFVETSIKLYELSDVKGATHIYWTFANGMNNLSLVLGLFAACMAGMFFWCLRNLKVQS